MPLKNKPQHLVEEKGVNNHGLRNWIIIFLGGSGIDGIRRVYKKYYPPSAIQEKSEINKSDKNEEKNGMKLK